MNTAAKSFVDSNILIYANDKDEPAKQKLAIQVLDELWVKNSGVLSVQVLQEFYYNITRKIRKPLARSEARDVVEEYAIWCGATGVREVREALRIESSVRISFWDALIVASAVQRGATRIFSEDMNHGQIIEGIEIVNPFHGL